MGHSDVSRMDFAFLFETEADLVKTVAVQLNILICLPYGFAVFKNRSPFRCQRTVWHSVFRQVKRRVAIVTDSQQ